MNPEWESTTTGWLPVGSGINLSLLPKGVEYKLDGSIFWVRQQKPLSLEEVARIVEGLLVAVQDWDGDLRIDDGDEYFAVGVKVD